jgi:hypothetical protein
MVAGPKIKQWIKKHITIYSIDPVEYTPGFDGDTFNPFHKSKPIVILADLDFGIECSLCREIIAENCKDVDSGLEFILKHYHYHLKG